MVIKSPLNDDSPKIESFHLKTDNNDLGKHQEAVDLKQETKEVDIEEEQDKKKVEGEVKVDEEMMTGSIMKREKSVSESTSTEVGIVRTG